MGFRVPDPVARLCLNVQAAGSASTTRPTSTTPVASPWSPSSTAKPSHETVERAIVALENLEHRGAAGADPNTGDGAGILLQLPDEFLRGVIDAELPPPGAYGVCVLLPPARGGARAPSSRRCSSRPSTDEGQRVVGWRDVPVDKDYVGITANLYAPYVKQLVVARLGRAGGRPGRVRAQAVRDPPRGRARRRAGARDPELQQPHDRLQGHADQPAAARLLPGPAGPADQVRARARPLALLAPTRSRAGSSRTRTG